MVMQVAPVTDTAPHASRAVVIEEGQPTQILNLKYPMTVGELYAKFHDSGINASISLAYGNGTFVVRINGIAIHENNSITI